MGKCEQTKTVRQTDRQTTVIAASYQTFISVLFQGVFFFSLMEYLSVSESLKLATLNIKSILFYSYKVTNPNSFEYKISALTCRNRAICKRRA